jgi:WD repeat-containing protein 23
MGRYPGYGYAIQHPHDQSVMTYRGHEVRQTLIRAKFSPAYTTGGRYIYSGAPAGLA